MNPQVFFFTDEEKHKTISPELLPLSVNLLNPDRTPPATRPVESFELMDQINQILQNENIIYDLRPVIVQRNGSDLLLNRQQRAEIPMDQTPVSAWQFKKILMQWVFANEENLKPGITVAFHERGIDMAFGLFNSFCYNHSIFGDHWYTTYNTKSSVKRLYEDMINGLIAWLHNFEQNLSIDREIVQRMMDTKFESKNKESLITYIIGALYRKAHNQAYGNKEAAPFTINNLSQFVSDLQVHSFSTQGIPSNTISLWDIYNIGTNLAKPEHMSIDAINQNNVLWGHFVNHELNEKLIMLN